MTHAKTAIGLILNLVLMGTVLASEGRPPSTPAERERALTVAHALEENPLSERAAADRAWVTSWIHEVPDVRVIVCLDLVEPVLMSFRESKDPLLAALSVQLMISGAAFVLEHPERASDEVAVSLAGLMGVLRAYERIAVVQPKYRIEYLNGLIQTREEGTLQAFVAAGLAKCHGTK